MLFERNTISGKSIQIWCLNMGVAKTGQAFTAPLISRY